MKSIHTYISVVALFAMLACSSEAFAASPTSDLAKDAFKGEAAFSWIVKTTEGWPQLHRPYNAVGMAMYRDWTLACYTVQLAPGASATGKTVEGAWDYQKIAYDLPGGKKASVIVSRLTPAVLVESAGDTVTLAPPEAYQLPSPNFSYLPKPKINPPAAKYAAFVSGGKVQVKPTAELGNVSLGEPWMLLWYGTDSHLNTHWDATADPSGPTWGGQAAQPIMQDLKPIDLPVLVRFEKKPTSITFNNGIEFKFAGEAGKLAVLPLMGNKLIAPETTEGWSAALPADILAQCRLWSKHLSDYPLTIKESSTYDKDSDVLSIVQAVKFLPLEDDWNSESTKAAPVSPMVALAAETGYPVAFQAGGKTVTPVDMKLMDTPGKAKVIPGTETYAIELGGLAKYALAQPTESTTPAGAEKYAGWLEAHIDAMAEAGRLKPLNYIYAVASHINQTYEFASSAECADALRAAYPYLSEDGKKKALAYVTDEWKVNPPFQPNAYNKGAGRAPYAASSDQRAEQRDKEEQKQNRFRDVLLVDKFQTAVGDDMIPADELKSVAKREANELLMKQDWALCGPGETEGARFPKYFHLQGEGVYNSWLAGAYGFARLANRHGWAEEPLAWYLAGKLTLARLGQAQYIKALHESGGVQGEYKDDWRCVVHIEPKCAILARGNFDFRIRSDQEIPKFYNLTPEVATLLADYAKEDSVRYLDQLDHSTPWYWISEADKQAATEHRLTPLHWKGGAVLAQYWIAGKQGDAFLRYVDTTRFKGDYYYIQNLAALIDSCGEK